MYFDNFQVIYSPPKEPKLFCSIALFQLCA